jgi:DNA-binding MarR family transcriptional regulator
MGKIDKEMDTKFPNDKIRLLANIVYTSQWIRGNFEKSIKPYKLSSPQFNVLRILRGAGEWLNMNQVRERMVEKSPNTTRLCDKLIEKELIERRRCDEDRRVVFLQISEGGLKLLADIDKTNDGSQMKFIENITEKEAKMMSDLIDKLRG